MRAWYSVDGRGEGTSAVLPVRRCLFSQSVLVAEILPTCFAWNAEYEARNTCLSGLTINRTIPTPVLFIMDISFPDLHLIHPPLTLASVCASLPSGTTNPTPIRSPYIFRAECTSSCLPANAVPPATGATHLRRATHCGPAVSELHTACMRAWGTCTS
jgi:hypothetical protein